MTLTLKKTTLTLKMGGSYSPAAAQPRSATAVLAVLLNRVRVTLFWVKRDRNMGCEKLAHGL